MGKLLYGDNGISLEFEDRALAHLQAIFVAKLRRGETFAFTSVNQVGGERTSLWIHPSASLAFVQSGSTKHPLNQKWLELMTAVANTANGLNLMDEPKDALPELPPAHTPRPSAPPPSNLPKNS